MLEVVKWIWIYLDEIEAQGFADLSNCHAVHATAGAANVLGGLCSLEA